MISVDLTGLKMRKIGKSQKQTNTGKIGLHFLDGSLLKFILNNCCKNIDISLQTNAGTSVF